jgi:flotillin
LYEENLDMGVFRKAVFHIEKADVLSLEVFTVEIPRFKLRSAPGGPVDLDCAAQVKIKSDDVSLSAAAECFLNKNQSDMKVIVRPLLEKQLGITLNTSSLKEITDNPQACAARVQTAASPDLARMGLEIISISFRNVAPG